MASLYVRKGMLWCRLKNEHGKWVSKRTGFRVGEEAAALKEVAKAQALADGRRNQTLPAGPFLVKEYAERWRDERERLGVATAKGQYGRLKKHVLPVIGDLELSAVRPRHLAELFIGLRTAKNGLSPKSVINLYSSVRAMFRDARIGDLVENTPAILTKHQVGSPTDADPTWRRSAVFSREEIELLLTADSVSLDLRMMIALAALAGLRHGEIAGLTWGRYDTAAKPLDELAIVTSYDKGRTKTGDARLVPVHPRLAKLLESWRDEWPSLFHREPGPDDPIVPMVFDEPEKQARPNPRGGLMRRKTDTYKPWTTALDTLGLRHRRFHDLRATFITLALHDGAEPHVLERVTHNPKSTGTAFQGYNRTQWPTLCREVAKLRISLKRRSRASKLATARATRSATKQNSSRKLVEAPGVEGAKLRVSARVNVAPDWNDSQRASSSPPKHRPDVASLATQLAVAVLQGRGEAAQALARELLRARRSGAAVAPTARA